MSSLEEAVLSSREALNPLTNILRWKAQERCLRSAVLMTIFAFNRLRWDAE